MATSIQAPQRKQEPAASPSDSISITTTSTTANSAQIKRVLKPTVRSASSDTNKASSSDQNRHLPSYHKPTKRSPPHESFRYVKKDGQNERNSATQNHKAAVSSGPTRGGTTRTARRTSLSPGAKTAASPSAERASKGSKPGKIHQLYVKKTTPLSSGKETHGPAASTEISKDVAVDPVSHADNLKTKKEEAFVKETKKVQPVEEEVTIPTETVAETEKVLVDVSVSEGNEEERKKLQISDVSTVSEKEENQSPSAVDPSESLAEKEDEVEDDGNSAMRIEKDKKEEVLEERKNKVKAFVGAFETVIDYGSSSK